MNINYVKSSSNKKYRKKFIMAVKKNPSRFSTGLERELRSDALLGR